MTVASFSAMEPAVMKTVFDGLIAGAGAARVFVPFAALVAMLAVREVVALAQERLLWRARVGVNFALLQATVERLHALPLSFHREASVGATMTKIERGIAGAMTAFTELLSQLVPAVVYLVVSVAIMLRIDVRLSAVVLLFAPVPAVIGALAAAEQARREHVLLDRWTRIFARFNEVLTGIVVVKSCVMEEREKRRFLGGVDDANRILLRGVAKDSLVNTGRNGSMVAARLVAIALGGTLVMHHAITLGTLIAFVAYLGGLFQPLQALTGTFATVHRASVSIDSILSILEAHDSLGDCPDAHEPGPFRGEVHFEAVTFGYRPGAPVLRGIDLRVRPGERIALVGPNGAGKTTLMALLQRLYDPTEGRVLIDGMDVRRLKQRSLRAQIGVVLQEGLLFNDTIYDNIAFGNPNATREQVEDAARAASIHDFIAALPEGYLTPVGERGGKLSGGERQRIAIARTLLKDAPILVLDEATSALDPESEEKVQDALERLSAGRTTFVVAHRLTTVISADRIAVFKDGAITEIGSHAELMRRDAYYASLVRRQIRGLISERPPPRDGARDEPLPRSA
jgi:ATP-binding cassette subfamily B protein